MRDAHSNRQAWRWVTSRVARVCRHAAGTSGAWGGDERKRSHPLPVRARLDDPV